MKRTALCLTLMTALGIACAQQPSGEVADTVYLFDIDDDQIYGTNVLQTILGGNVVYDRSEQGR